MEAAGVEDGPCLTVLAASRLGEVDVRGGLVGHPLRVGRGERGRVRPGACARRAPGGPPARTTPDWARELALLRPWLSDPARPTVVVGDLNATLEHGPLQAALGVGRPVTRRVAATWPSRWRRAFGVTIDHVLVAGPVGVRSVEVLDVPGSDHRAVLARFVV